MAFLAGHAQKIWGYKRCRSFFVTCFFCLPSPSRYHHHTNYIPIFGHHLLTHSHILFYYTLSPSSCHLSRLYLRSTLLSVRIITKLFYQTYHIHLGPIHTFPGLDIRPLSSFQSVKLFFFVMFWRSLTFFQKTTGPEITVASPNIQVSYTSLRPNSDTDDIPPSPDDHVKFCCAAWLLSSALLIPYSGSHFQCIFWYLFNPRCFLRSREVDLGEFDWRFVYVHLLIPLFLVAQFVIYHPKTETHQAKALRR